MQTLLVLASTYPRWPNDTEPAFVHDLCRELAKAYRVIVLAPHFAGAQRVEVLDGIEVYRFRYGLPALETLAYEGGIMANLGRQPLKWLLVPLFLASQLFSLVRLARKHDVALVHAHWLLPQGVLATFARRWRLLPRDTRILLTSHGGDLFTLQGGLLQRLKLATLRQGDHATVVSTAMKHHLESMGCATHRITVQSMGVDLENRFTPQTGIEKPLHIIYVGRLVEKKGVTTLVDALAQLVQQHPDLTAAIVGDGPERASLEQQVRHLGLDTQVVFHGAVPNPEVPAYYRSAEIAVVPSVVASDGDQEGLGLVAVEALGCGCATVVSDLPALADVVTHDDNGLVFRAGNAEDLGACLGRLLGDPALRSRLSARARASVLGRFDWQTVGNRYRDIIGNTLNTPVTPP